MLNSISVLRGYAIEANDGPLGTVKDLLFDDRSWKLRWLVVETGCWQTERKVLLHPSAVMRTDRMLHLLIMNLTRSQVEKSPGIDWDLPLSQRLEGRLYSYYHLDPTWGGRSYFDRQANPPPMILPRDLPTGDGHLRSTLAITGYGVQAKDGDIGHVENFLFDDIDWSLRYLVIDTRTWWHGKRVLLSPYAITDIDWFANRITVNVTRSTIRNGPDWLPNAFTDRSFETRLHHHYGWRGYGW